MNTLMLMALALLATAPRGVTEPLPDDLVKRLGAAVRQHCPEAQIEVTETAFTAKYGTMMFTVHARNKTGEVQATTYQEEGPNFRGFLLSVSREEGAYRGAAVTPQTLQGPYFPTYVDAPPTEDSKGHYWIRFSYGSRLDPRLKEALLAALPATKLQKTTPENDR